MITARAGDQSRGRCRRYAIVLLIGVLSACRRPSDPGVASAGSSVRIDSSDGNVTVVARQGAMRNFPCMQCHDKIDLPDGKGKRNPHDDLRLQHFEGITNCALCHDLADMNQLRTLANVRLSFDESYRICAQCHGEKARDWRINAHGKQVGSWSGAKTRYGCPECHNPHAPTIASSQALKAPPFPQRGIPKGAH